MGALVTLVAVVFCVCIGFVAIHASPAQKPNGSHGRDRAN